MKKKLIIILTAVVIIAVLAAMYVCALPLLREALLPAVPVAHHPIEISDYALNFSLRLSDAEDAAALAETICAIKFPEEDGWKRQVATSVTYDEQQGIYAVELMNVKYAADARSGRPLNLLGGAIVIYLDEASGSVLAYELRD